MAESRGMSEKESGEGREMGDRERRLQLIGPVSVEEKGLRV